MSGKLAEWGNTDVSVSIVRYPKLDSRFVPSRFISPFILLLLLILPFCTRASTATRYGFNGPGIEFPWERDFPLPFRSALGPTQSPV